MGGWGWGGRPIFGPPSFPPPISQPPVYFPMRSADASACIDVLKALVYQRFAPRLPNGNISFIEVNYVTERANPHYVFKIRPSDRPLSRSGGAGDLPTAPATGRNRILRRLRFDLRPHCRAPSCSISATRFSAGIRAITPPLRTPRPTPPRSPDPVTRRHSSERSDHPRMTPVWNYRSRRACTRGGPGRN